jgi:hypothetical protein
LCCDASQTSRETTFVQNLNIAIFAGSVREAEIFQRLLVGRCVLIHSMRILNGLGGCYELGRGSELQVEGFVKLKGQQVAVVDWICERPNV